MDDLDSDPEFLLAARDLVLLRGFRDRRLGYAISAVMRSPGSEIQLQERSDKFPSMGRCSLNIKHELLRDAVLDTRYEVDIVPGAFSATV